MSRQCRGTVVHTHPLPPLQKNCMPNQNNISKAIKNAEPAKRPEAPAISITRPRNERDTSNSQAIIWQYVNLLCKLTLLCLLYSRS